MNKQKVTGIGGLFFRSQNPKALATWYSENLGIDIMQGIWIQQTGPTVFMPFSADTDYFPAKQNWMINFRVDDLDAMLTQLAEAGIAAETRAEWDSDIGRFARIYDPEGNPIELWQPAHSSE
ncbi:VOC family protein [Bowmanella sp. Y26]|uniref:VOC family protein n=1 Tax=Bowmanella yangjiangensis TaxID=2811230 RepID=UPI001BDC0FE3|nr:VOC family protein [Bowmanella yangjiangensis]MBT1062253.1 VOC family protein [Bowmanella yangjiangensis]